MTHKSILSIGIFLLVSISPLSAQRLKIDTIYYNGSGETVEKTADYLTYEIRQLDRKKRVNGLTERYTKSDRLLEITEYKKDEKSGVYERYHRDGEIMIYGTHEKGGRVSFWATFSPSGEILTIEEYDNNHELLETRKPPYMPKVDIKNVSTSISTSEDVILVVEENAEFPGGMGAWNQYLRKNLNFPTSAKQYGIQGEVYLSFIVLADGRIAIPRVVSSPDKSLSDEGLRVLRFSPKWNPATYKGEPVDSKMKLRISFRSR